MKLKLTNDQMGAIIGMLILTISEIDRSGDYSDDREADMMASSNLSEMLLHLQTKYLVQKKKYSVTIKPTWGFAIRWTFGGCIDYNSPQGVIIGSICDEMYRLYIDKINPKQDEQRQITSVPSIDRFSLPDNTH